MKRHSFTYTQNGTKYIVTGVPNDHGLASDMDIESVVNPAGHNILEDLYNFDQMDDIQAEADREAVKLFPEASEEEVEEYFYNQRNR